MGKTVFILGAGASRAFGEHMPIGSGLADQISDRLYEEFEGRNDESPISNALRRLPGGLSGEHTRAASHIVGALQAKSSIDELIDDWPNFPEVAQVGKASIAACILQAEQKTLLNLPLSRKADWGRALRTLRETWAGQLFRAIGAASMPNAFQAFHDTAFVTFNYDRCLEQFLLANFIHSSGMMDRAAFNAMSNIEIHHAYGALGEILPSEHDSVETPYGSDDVWAISRAATRIKTFSEEPGDVSRIQSLILGAKRLVFLGFGYHPRNLDLLFGVGREAPEVECWGTTSGLTRRATAIVNERFTSAASKRVWQPIFADEFMVEHIDDVVTLYG